MRINIINRVLIFIFLSLALGVFKLQVIEANKYQALSYKNCIRLLPQAGVRGKILDRNNLPIVEDHLSYDVMLSVPDNQQLDKTLGGVSAVLGVEVNKLKSAFKKGYAGPSLPVIIAKNIDTKKAIALGELKSVFPNLIVQPHPQRYYPYARLASHVIGYLNEIDHWRLTKLEDYGYKKKDLVGFGGIEEKYDYYLRQEDGAISLEVDHRGRFRRVVGFKPPRNGQDIQLTLDLKIQKIVEDALGDRIGSAVIMDPYSGEIIAMANNPAFNPAVFLRRGGVSLEYLFRNPEAPLINRAISGLYPLGSVFKVVVAAAGLETGKINLATTFTCNGATMVGRQQFACWDIHLQQGLLGALAHSCNVFFYRTGLLVGAPLIHEYALKFGLSRPTLIDLPYEASGFIPNPMWKRIYRLQNWFDGDTANLAIGQGEVLVTPLQVTRLMAVFANRGTLVKPYILKAVAGRDVSLSQIKKTKLVLKEETINSINRGLKRVAGDLDGTASILAGVGVEVAGKTGTAQVSRGQAHGWFAGFFPYKQPKYVLCVFLEHGTAGYYASVVARDIIQGMIKESLL